MKKILLEIFRGEKWNDKQYKWFFFILAAAFYISTTSNGYSIDDSLVNGKNKYVGEGLQGISDILTHPYQETEEASGEFRPVAQVSYAIEYAMFGEKPAVSHLLNTVLYGLICMSLFSLMIKFFDRSHFTVIFLGVFIFAIHPVHTEVVASLKNREGLFSMLFGLWSCIQLIKFIDSKKVKHLVLIFVFFALALLSKVDSIVFVGIIGAIAYFKGMKVKYISVTLFVLLCFFVLRNFYTETYFPAEFRTNHIYETPLFGQVTLWEKLGFAMVSLFQYLKLLVFPYPLRFYYGYNMIPIPGVGSLELWMSVILHLLLVVLLLKGFFKKTLLSFAVFWYLISISIFSQLLEPVTGIVGERHAFIASAGFCIVLAYGLVYAYQFFSKRFSMKPGHALVLIIAVSAGTFLYVQNRNADWKSDDSIFEADLPKLNHSAYAHFEYGNTLNRNADKAATKEDFIKCEHESISSYKKAADIYPEFTFALYNIGMVYLKLDDAEKANHYFQEAWQIDSTFRSTNYFLGLHKMSLSDSSAAMKLYERELRNRPENVRAIERLYDIYVPKGMIDKAIATFSQVEAKGAKNARVYFALSNLYVLKGDTVKAQKYLNFSQSDQVENNPDFNW